MKKLLSVLAMIVFSALISFGQKGKADPDYYPVGYPMDTWTGDVTAVDNDHRTLTLAYTHGKTVQTFVATIPDVPYEWTRDLRNTRVLDFPYDKTRPTQTFEYVGEGERASLLPNGGEQKTHRPNPPDANRISDFSDFKGRKIIVFYTERDRTVGGQTEKFNDVWRVRVISARKN